MSVYRRLTESSNEEEDEVYLQETGSYTGHTVKPMKQQTYTVEEAVEHMGFGRFQFYLTLLMGSFSFADACEMMLLAVLSPVVRCEWQLSAFQVACITTVVFVGMLIGSPVWGKSTDKYGRRPILLLVGVWMAYYGYLTALSPTYYWLLFLRFMVGFGIGGAPQGFTTLSEFLPSKHRARLLGSFQMFWAFGTCFEVFLAYLLIPTLGWRYLVGFSAVPLTIAVLINFKIIPESVRYCMTAGKRRQAMETLETVAKMNNTTLPEGVLVKSKEVERGKLKDLFAKGYVRTTLQLWYLWFTAAFCYYGLVLVSSEILEYDSVCGAAEDWNHGDGEGEVCHCQMLSQNDYLTLIFTTLGELLAIPVNVFLPDIIGRTRLLGLYFLFSAIFTALITVCSTRLFLTITVFAVRALTSGLFNIVYLYTVEVYPTIVRAFAVGSGSAIARVGAMATPFVAQVLLTYYVDSALIVYAVVCFIACILSFSLPIETMGRAIQEM